MEKKCIDSSRGKVYYWINTDSSKCNKERTIMFCHGLTADHTLFDKQIDAFKDDYCIITWDMPLHGESKPYIHFSFTALAKEMSTILKQEGIEKTFIVGQSAGGYAAQAFALFYPNNITGLAFVDSNPFGKRYYTGVELFFTNNYSKIASVYPFKYYCRACSENASCTPEGRKSFYDSLIKQKKWDILRETKAYYREFAKYEEVDFGYPVVLFCGEKDITGYVKKYNKEWADYENYPLVMIPDAAHNSNYDNYLFFNMLLKKFFADELGW